MSKKRKQKRTPSYIIDTSKIEEYLGIPKFKRKLEKKGNRIGSITGLAWTSVGGEILFVDATIMNGAEKLIITGQIGDVMKESAQAALSYLRSNAKELGL